MARANITAALAKHTGQRSVFKKAKLVLEKPPAVEQSLLSSLAVAVDTMTCHTTALNEMVPKLKQWKKDTVVSATAELEKHKQELAAAEPALVTALTAVESAAEKVRASTARAKKLELVAAKRQTKPWAAMGLPNPWINELKALHLTGDSGTTEQTLSSHLVEDSPAVGECAGSNSYVPTVVAVVSNAVDWLTPLWVPQSETADLASVLGRVRDVMKTDLGSRVSEGVARLSSHMVKHPSDPLSILRLINNRTTGTGARVADTENEYDSMLWLPLALRGPTETPEQVSGFGAPWLCTMRPYAHRASATEFPTLGLSHFVVVCSGAMAVFLWNLEVSDDIEVTAVDAHSWLMQLSRQELSDRVREKQLLHCRLEPGDVLWVPNGWITVYVNTGTVSCDSALLPVLSLGRATRELRYVYVPACVLLGSSL